MSIVWKFYSDFGFFFFSNGIKQESVIDVEKPSPPLMSHGPPPTLPDHNRLAGPPPPLNQSPNTAPIPGGYNQQLMPPMGAPPYRELSYVPLKMPKVVDSNLNNFLAGAVPPMMPNYGHPPGVNPMVMPPQHMANQSNVRMYHYPGQPMYNPQMSKYRIDAFEYVMIFQ